MIKKNILKESNEFRKLWSKRLSEYPALIPDMTWMSIWSLDSMCYFLRYRENWTDDERKFVRGVSAYIGEFINKCWQKLPYGITLQDGPDGIECKATLKKGFFSSETYILPVEKSIISILKKPKNPFPALGKQWIMASDKTKLLGFFGLGACLGMSPYGIGEWAEKFPGDLKEHMDLIVPFLAETTAEYYKRVFNNSVCADHELYLNNLIWPPGGYHGDHCSSIASEGIECFQKKGKNEITIDDFVNLAKLPDQTIQGGALIHLIIKLNNDNIPGGIAEVFFDEISRSASGYRDVAYNLANEKGMNIDWFEQKDQLRFKLEKRIHLLPLLYLDYETSVSVEYRDLVNSLLHFDIKKAQHILNSINNKSAELLFQEAMLEKVQGKNQEAHEKFNNIKTTYPEYENSKFFNEFGMNYFNLKDIQNSLKYLKTAYDMDKSNERILNNLAWVYICDNKLSQGLQLLDEATLKSDMLITALLNRSYAYKKIGEKEKADRDINKAFSIYPFDRRIIANIMPRFFSRE